MSDSVQIRYCTDADTAFDAHVAYVRQSPRLIRIGRILRWALIVILFITFGFLNNWGADNALSVDGVSYSWITQIFTLFILLAIAVGIGWPLAGYWGRKWIESYRKDFRDGPPERYADIVVIADDETFTMTSPVDSHTYRWCLLGDLIETEDYLYVLTAQQQRLISIPRKAITEAEIARLKNLAQKGNAP